MVASSSQPFDGLFDAELIERVEVVADNGLDTTRGMRKRLKDFEPDAVMLLPPSLEEWLPETHLAWFIAELVENELDLGRFYKSYAKAKGQPPYDPRLMLQVLLYGSCSTGPALRVLHRGSFLPYD